MNLEIMIQRWMLFVNANWCVFYSHLFRGALALLIRYLEWTCVLSCFPCFFLRFRSVRDLLEELVNHHHVHSVMRLARTRCLSVRIFNAANAQSKHVPIVIPTFARTFPTVSTSSIHSVLKAKRWGNEIESIFRFKHVLLNWSFFCLLLFMSPVYEAACACVHGSGL